MANTTTDITDSILLSIKKLIGVHETDDSFDPDLIMHTNTVLFMLVQMGIGKKGYYVTDDTQTWSGFFTVSETETLDLPIVKSWAGLKVKMLFDPPTSSVLAEAINKNLDELQWRFYITQNYTDEDMEETYEEIY